MILTATLVLKAFLAVSNLLRPNLYLLPSLHCLNNWSINTFKLYSAHIYTSHCLSRVTCFHTHVQLPLLPPPSFAWTCLVPANDAGCYCSHYYLSAFSWMCPGALNMEQQTWSWSRSRRESDVEPKLEAFQRRCWQCRKFSHAFFGLMMHLRSQHRRSSSSSSNSNPYYDPNSSTISCSAFPAAVKWNAATCNGSRASGNNLRKQSLQFTVLMSITKTNSSWHTAPSRLWPIYHSTILGFGVLCTPNNYARFPTISISLP